MESKLKAVIFDMDGVLIDSEPVYLKASLDFLSVKYDWVTWESLVPTVGMSHQEYRPFMAKTLRTTVDAPQFLKDMEEVSRGCKIYYPDILRPRVPELLKTLRRMGLFVALASSSPYDNIRQVLGECGLTEAFDVIVSGEQFHASKPDPEIYLYTMDKLKLKPQECLVIEDSTYGVTAGHRAGALVAALKDDRFPFDQSLADLHIRTLDQIPGLVRRGGRPVKAAFFDVDGTLSVMETHRIPESTRRALDLLREAGISLIVSTGRHALEIEEEQILPGLSFDGYIYLNGQLCELQGKEVLKNAIPLPQLEALRDFLERKHRSCVFLEKDAMYCNFADDRMIREQARIGTSVPPARSLENLGAKEVYQAIPFIDEEEEKELAARTPGCRMTRWGEGVVDLVTREGGKEKGMLAVCKALGISPDETIAFGDAENDRFMLRLAGIGVAMGNAGEEVKADADYVTSSIEEDGIWNACKYLGLI